MNIEEFWHFIFYFFIRVWDRESGLVASIPNMYRPNLDFMLLFLVVILCLIFFFSCIGLGMGCTIKLPRPHYCSLGLRKKQNWSTPCQFRYYGVVTTTGIYVIRHQSFAIIFIDYLKSMTVINYFCDHFPWNNNVKDSVSCRPFIRESIYKRGFPSLFNIWCNIDPILGCQYMTRCIRDK